MSWVTNTGWDYTTSPNRIYKSGFIGNLTYKSGVDKTFLPNKSYLFKTKIHNLSNFGSGFADFVKVKSNWGNSITFEGRYGQKYSGSGDGYIYLYSSPGSSVTTKDLMSYEASYSFGSSYGILEADVHEIDWSVNGYSWIGDDNFDNLPSVSSRSNGWSYDTTDGSFYWFDTESTTIEFDQPPSCAFNPYLYNPASVTGDITGEIPPCFSSNFKKINHISKFVDFQFFNFELSIDKYVMPILIPESPGDIKKDNDPLAGIKIYTSDTEPYTGNSITEFDNYVNQSNLVASLTQSGTYSFYGLPGNKYLYITGDMATFTQSASTQLRIYNLNLEGGYHPSNNQIYQPIISSGDLSFDPSFFEGATYSSFSGSGNSLDDNVVGLTLSSKVGNGTFLSGIWENGVWNSGWRQDNDVKELYDIVRSIKILSNIKWRIRITGLKSDIDDLNVGDYISIGNIIAIDINENRNILKDYYRIVNKGIEESRISYIEVDIDVQFPMRRIEKDSLNHRIKVTRNIWSSGVFLNGYFEGIWNSGLFRGYPLITKMNKTNWIDGTFEGGHFESNYYISGSFSQTFRDAESLPAKLGLSFTTPHNVKVGDDIEITIDDSINSSRYDGDSKVIKVIDDLSFVTDTNYGLFVDNESGEFTTKLTTGLVQNVKFNSNNVSTITSVDSMISSSVFIYNSWLDVTYEDDSAVNIGKPQNILDNISKKSYSENNLYGYPTNDILSSVSKFRDSYSNTERFYNLGNKYRIFEDFVGDSSKFTEYFEPETPSLFSEQGWTYSKAKVDSITFSRTESLGESSILGEELKIDSISKGGVLDISEPEIAVNRTSPEITKNKYTLVEFDLVKSKINNVVNENYGLVSDAHYNLVPLPGSKISPSFSGEPEDVYENFGLNNALEGVVNGEYAIRREPLLHFNNINKIRREFIEGSQSVSNIYELEATYLPVYENVNHVTTKKTKKVEYFYNKRNLAMNFRGNGFFGELPSGYVINNLKLYEVDMIPFFQYFTDLNINTSVQVPLQGVSPYIRFTKKNSNIINKSSIGFDSFDIFESNVTFLATLDDLTND